MSPILDEKQNAELREKGKLFGRKFKAITLAFIAEAIVVILGKYLELDPVTVQAWLATVAAKAWSYVQATGAEDAAEKTALPPPPPSGT